MSDILNEDAIYYDAMQEKAVTANYNKFRNTCIPFLNPSHLNQQQAQKFDNLRDDTISFLIYFSSYTNICISKYKWVGTSITHSRLIEKFLYYFASCAIIKIDNMLKPYKYIVVEWNTETGEPNKIDCYDLFGNIVQQNVTEFVIIYDNLQYIPKMLTVFRYSMKYAQLDRAIDSNISKQFIPILLKGTPEQKKVLERFARKYEQGIDYWFIDKDAMNEIATLDLHIDFKASQLYDVLQKEKNELNSLLGINNENINKESGVSEAEVNANDEYIDRINADAYLLRQEAVTQIAEVFGEKWEVFEC